MAESELTCAMPPAKGSTMPSGLILYPALTNPLFYQWGARSHRQISEPGGGSTLTHHHFRIDVRAGV